MARKPIFRRPIRDFLLERKPANPYDYAIQLLEGGALANSIVILRGITQKTGCGYCVKQIENTIIPAIERNEISRAKKLIEGLKLIDETLS